MSTIRTLERNIRERQTGLRSDGHKANRGKWPGTRKRRRLARRRNMLAKASRTRNRRAG